MGRTSLAKQRRRQIVEALLRCIARDGLAASSTRAVAKEAGVRQSVLLHYFGNRDEMLEELFGMTVEGTIGKHKAKMQRCKNPQERFEKSIEFLFGKEVVPLEHGSLYYDYWSEAHRNERVRKTIRRLIHVQREYILGAFAETGKTDALSADEMKEIANIVIALYEGVYYLTDMDRDNVSVKRIVSLIRQFVELYVEERAAQKSKA